ncbi:MAG: hypothetical protein NZ889_03070 [Candidatus Pacearchaeota archaeon]|nr:hypothetical protein [Candidatus Pacearchaeota archaeon]
MVENRECDGMKDLITKMYVRRANELFETVGYSRNIPPIEVSEFSGVARINLRENKVEFSKSYLERSSNEKIDRAVKNMVARYLVLENDRNNQTPGTETTLRDVMNKNRGIETVATLYEFVDVKNGRIDRDEAFRTLMLLESEEAWDGIRGMHYRIFELETDIEKKTAVGLWIAWVEGRVRGARIAIELDRMLQELAPEKRNEKLRELFREILSKPREERERILRQIERGEIVF